MNLETALNKVAKEFRKTKKRQLKKNFKKHQSGDIAKLLHYGWCPDMENK